MNWLKRALSSITSHLTKLLGALGAGLMSLLAVDPASVRDAAQTYLGAHAAEKIGVALFVLVILRGWYTGVKAQRAAVLQPPSPQTQRP